MPSGLHVDFLPAALAGHSRDVCRSEFGKDCERFSELPATLDFCSRSTFPPAVCFEKLGVVVRRPGVMPKSAGISGGVTFTDDVFARFRLPEINSVPWTKSPDGAPDLEWPLDRIGITADSPTGRGIRVCIVDSGVDEHPDIIVRDEEHVRSFRREPLYGDPLGHGTFNAGIICGAAKPKSGPRYGVAPDVELFVAKVFDESRTACTISMLAAIEWALQMECHIVSMSIGKQIGTTSGVNALMSMAADRALDQKLLIVSGTGNDCNRDLVPPRLAPVAFPASCPGIIAVGAIQRSGALTASSNIQLPGTAALVDLVAPGKDVRSASLGETYATASGTSVATPHVAGVAALFAEASGARGRDLWNLVASAANPLRGSTREESGAGVVRAP